MNTGTVDIASITTSVRNEAGATVASQTLIPSVPEPAALALLGLGLAGLGFARRRE